MTTLDELSPFLEREYEPNYWSDDMVMHVAKLIDGLQPAEWARLEDVWITRPAVWQAQLADALTGSAQPRRDAVLAAMLGSPHLEVAQTAASSLIASRDWGPSDADREVLTALRRRMPPGEQAIVDELIARAPA